MRSRAVDARRGSDHDYPLIGRAVGAVLGAGSEPGGSFFGPRWMPEAGGVNDLSTARPWGPVGGQRLRRMGAPMADKNAGIRDQLGRTLIRWCLTDAL